MLKILLSKEEDSEDNKKSKRASAGKKPAAKRAKKGTDDSKLVNLLKKETPKKNILRKNLNQSRHASFLPRRRRVLSQIQMKTGANQRRVLPKKE